MGQEFVYSKGGVNCWFSVAESKPGGTKSAGGIFQVCSGIRESRRGRSKLLFIPSLEPSQGKIVLCTDFSVYLQISCSLLGQFNWQLLLILSPIIVTSTWWHSLSSAANSHPLMPPEWAELAIHVNHPDLKDTVTCHNFSLIYFRCVFPVYSQPLGPLLLCTELRYISETTFQLWLIHNQK